MSDRMLKVKACEHTSRTLVFASGEDAPGKSLDTCEQCNTCGAVIHDYRHGGGQRSPNYPIVRQSPLLEPLRSIYQQLIEAERTLNARGMSCTPDLDMIRLAKENERLRLDLAWAKRAAEDSARRWADSELRRASEKATAPPLPEPRCERCDHQRTAGNSGPAPPAPARPDADRTAQRWGVYGDGEWQTYSGLPHEDMLVFETRAAAESWIVDEFRRECRHRYEARPLPEKEEEKP